ncbi:hypothetical protein T484DRAFT_1813584 [Baffinella frigidus]|nr:hypothetical protein T484DRAFT_1813584 [Cryptophyta sp. CCMP2293]
MYNNNAGHQDEPETMIMKAWLEPLLNKTMIMKAWLEPLLNKHKVDCVLAGHVLAYERMHGILPSSAYRTGRFSQQPG